MQDVQARARRNGERSLNHVPLGGFGAIQRTVTVRLPDSLCYALSATWTKDPNFKVRKEIATQTDFEETTKKYIAFSLYDNWPNPCTRTPSPGVMKYTILGVD